MQLQPHALEADRYDMEQAPASWPYNALVLGEQEIQPSYHLTTDPISTPIEQRLLYTGGQPVNPHRQNRDHKKSKRARKYKFAPACVRCRRKKRKCAQDKPCYQCMKDGVHCEYTTRSCFPTEFLCVSTL